MSQRGPSPIQAIDRAVALMSAIAAAGPGGIGLGDLTASVGVHASTGRTLLASLIMNEMVDQVAETRNYVLGTRCMDFARTFQGQVDVAAVAAPELTRLWHATEETVHLAVLQGGRRVNLAIMVSPQLLNVNPTTPQTQERDPDPASLYRTAAGKMLLAGLDDDAISALLSSPAYANRYHERGLDEVLELVEGVRRAGYATNVEEEAPGVCGLAAPVRDSFGRTVAAVCVGYPSIRHTPDHAASLRDATIAAADAVSAAIGHPSSTEVSHG